MYDPDLNTKYSNSTSEPASDVSVSHQAILPPLWCSLPSDAVLYTRAPPVTQNPQFIVLDQSARCLCGAYYDPKCPVVREECTIYCLTQAYKAELEVQPCSSCSKKGFLIGPDTRNISVLNLDNKRLFAHDLLDEYTSAFTASATPFSAWVSTKRHTYKTYRSSKPFVTENTFRDAWFAYVRLQQFVGDMTCTICGTNPERIIWDGVTVAYRKDKVLPSLCPPTFISDNSPIRSSVRYQPKQQFIEDKKVRQLVQAALRTCEKQGHGRATDNDDPPSETSIKHDLDMKNIVAELGKIGVGLALLFVEGVWATERKQTYRELFRQISSDESAVRFATTRDVDLMNAFLANPTPFHASRLIGIPALYLVLQAEHSQYNLYPDTILQIARWISNRLSAVFKKLLDNGEPLEMAEDLKSEDWQKTGAIYSMPKIRERPRYPRIPHEKEKSMNDRGGKCSKYYTQYGKQNLTGGIMGAWCSHVICYGFHCIPESEGRDDVFSAMVTRWPEAPKVVIYDFACSLGPYCLLREPSFFANTKFLIDDFHASNHKKCDRAYFLSTYARTDPRLAGVNSSAAECGNCGLNRIRKSISYMSQARAIIYIKTFISVWNRKQLRKQLGLV